ncbi:MAG: hypothetical protein KAU23_07745, partial [Anaerolineales bacterium]|nr:hypothetical protein [Anaerolineales bacterium]
VKVSLVAGIGLNIYLLWQGRRISITRFVKIAENLFSIAVLALLVQGHSVWLAERGSFDILGAIEAIAGIADGGWELVGMHAFRMAFGVALIVIVIETLVMLYRMVRSKVQTRTIAVLPPASA